MLINASTSFICAKNNDDSSPSSVVKQFYEAVEKGDEKTINELVVCFGKILSTDKWLSSMWIEGNLKEQQETYTKGEGIIKLEEIIDENDAIVKIIWKNNGWQEQRLKKINGKWKIRWCD